MHVIPDEGESARPNKKSKSSELTYQKKDAIKYTSAYDKVLNSLNKLYTFYNPTMPIMHEPLIKGKYEVTGETRVILIVMEHEEDEIKWACNTSISTDAGEPETPKEAMTRPNGNLWRMSAIYEVNIFL